MEKTSTPTFTLATTRTYYLLTKPGIMMGNAITTVAGFLLASKGHIDFWLFLATLLGLSSIIGSACVFNNYIDRVADAKMARTKNRALAKGIITSKSALLFAIALGVVGTIVLAVFTNLLAVSMALLGFFVYVILYSFSKYHSVYGTLIGSIAGALPPVVGYCAVSQRLDAGALILFSIIALWQMPHFFSIAIYRLEDYISASIPVLPIKSGMQATKIQMLLYIIAFMIAAVMLTAFGYTGYVYMAVAIVLGIAWLRLCIKGFKSDNDKRWARKMFALSLVIITLLSIMMSIETLFPKIAV